MSIKTFFNKLMFNAKMHAPEIKTGLVVAGVVGGTALTWRAAIKTNDIMKERQRLLDEVIALLNEKKITAEEAEAQKKDIRKQAVWKVVKAVAPGTTVLAVTIGVTIENTVAMKKDISGATASAMGAIAMLNKYRERVRDDQGAAKDVEYAYGMKPVEVKTVDEEGNETSKETLSVKSDEFNPLDFSFLLDCSWPLWTDDDDANLRLIELIKEQCNTSFCQRETVWYYNETLRKFELPLKSYGWNYGNFYNPNDPDRYCYIDWNVYTFDKEKEEGLMDPRELVYLIIPNVEGPINGEMKKYGWMVD